MPHFQAGVVGALAMRSRLDAMHRDLAHFSVRAIPHLLAFRPDITMLAESVWPVVAAKAARQLGGKDTRIVVTSHTGWSSLPRDDLRLGVDGFVALQPEVFQKATDFTRGRIPVQLIPNGVDVAHFANAAAAPIPLSAPIAIVVSALVDYKRIDLAIRATAHAGLSLLVIGDGPNINALTSLARELLGPAAFLHLPNIPHDAIAPYYRAAQIFTLPSMASEGFGMTILEAMAAGLPVVVNNDPARRWIAGSTGWFVDPENITEYAKVLRLAVERGADPSAQNHVARFSWNAVAQDYAEFFVQLLAAKPT